MRLQIINIHNYTRLSTFYFNSMDELTTGSFNNQVLIFDRKTGPIKYSFFDLIKMFIKNLINKLS